MLNNLMRGDYVEIPIQVMGMIQENPLILEPIDITDSVIYFTGKRYLYLDDADADIQVIAEMTDPTLGKATIVLPVAKTDLLQPGDLYYDIQIVDPSGKVVTVDREKIEVLADVTRRVI